MSKTPLRVVYDGQCPFCSRYVELVRLKQQYDVELVDARQNPDTAENYGLDLNEGMIADLDGKVHHGADAVWLLSMLSERPGLLSRRRIAKALYPWLRRGRRLTLRILGREPI
jgi:predicted DCC family thiol-disulfide oxidoreductase YuxK